MITDYSTLKDAIANWLARADLTNIIPELIQMGESRIWRDLRSQWMLSTDEDALSGSAYALPAAFIELASVAIYSSGCWRILEPLSITDQLNGATEQTPRGYVIRGGYLYVEGGTGTEEIRVSYWGKYGGGGVSDSNVGLIAKFPDIYLYAALLEATPYLKADARIPVWQAAYSRAIDTENANTNSSRWATSARIKPVHRAP